MGRQSEKQLELSNRITDERTEKTNKRMWTKGSGLKKEPGFFIKEARLRKEMSLEDVCAGICSPSYLSKIENLEIPWDESNSKHQRLKQRLEIDFSNMPAGNWLKKYQKLIWSKNHTALSASIQRLKEGYHHRLLLFALYVLLDTFSQARGMVGYLYKIEPYLSVYELQLLYYCLGNYLTGPAQGYYLLNSLRMARYFRLQDPLLHLALAKYSFTVGAEFQSFRFLGIAEDLFQDIGAHSYYIDCLLLKCHGYLHFQLPGYAHFLLEKLNPIKNQFAPDQKAAYFMVQGLYFQSLGQPKEAEKAFIRSLAVARRKSPPIFERSLVYLTALYSERKRKKLLQKLLAHPAVSKRQLEKLTDCKLEFYEKNSESSQTAMELMMQLRYHYFPQALDAQDSAFANACGQLMMAYYEDRGQYKKSIEIKRQLEAFEHTVKTFQITLSNYF